MLSVVTWKWNRPDGSSLFGPEYVNRMRSMMERHLHVEHRVVCVTDDAAGLDLRVDVVPLPHEFSGSPRCIRRLRQYDEQWSRYWFGPRFLSIDLDMVVTGDVTHLFDRTEPLVCWRLGWRHEIYGGALVLMDAGALRGLWERFSADPWGYALAAQASVYHKPTPGAPWSGASDQPVLNYYIRTSGVRVADLKDEDGLTTYRNGFRPKDPPMSELRPGVRLVSFGHGSIDVMEGGKHEWVRENWR
jgi:hypothetical protein